MLRVSVALCTYNGERFLEEQLGSLAAQTRLPAELVVTDDASADRSAALLDAFAADAPFPVRVMRNARNLGSTASFERTIAACRGELVALCDQDDLWRPAKIERLAQALEADRHAGYAFCDADVVDETLRPLGLRMWDTVGFGNGAWRAFRGERQIDMLMERTRVTGATMVIRASRFAACRPFPADVVHDRWLATVLSAIGAHGVTVAESLVAYRQHTGQQIGVGRALQRRSLRAQVSRDFVLEQRRRMRRECTLGARFIEHIDWLLAEPGALASDEAAQARRSRALAADRYRHVAARAALDDASSAATMATIVRELASGDYRRYSGGLRAMLSDVLYCVRDRRHELGPRPVVR